MSKTPKLQLIPLTNPTKDYRTRKNKRLSRYEKDEKEEKRKGTRVQSTPEPSLRKEVTKYSASISIEDLFRYLETINLPGSTAENGTAPLPKSLRHRTFGAFFHHEPQQSTVPAEPDPVANRKFLKSVKKFFTREKQFWRTFFQDVEHDSPTITRVKKSNTNRPWAHVFNTYLAENPAGAWFFNCLDLQRIQHYCAIISKYIHLENEKNNTENSLASAPIIERAKCLLTFLETHKHDPFSSIIGLQASQSIVSSCITNAAPSKLDNFSFDLSRYIIEVSTLKNDNELAKNVRVLSAKIRGIFATVSPGSVVLLSLPSNDEEIGSPPDIIKTDGQNYENCKGLTSFLKDYDNSFGIKIESKGSFRAAFARCAVKPTSDNWVGLWLGTHEYQEKIIWAPVSRIYNISAEHLTWLNDPNEEISNIEKLITNFYDQIEKSFSNQIEEIIMEQLKRQLNLDEEAFARMMRSRTLFIDEKTMIEMHTILQNLLNDSEKFNSLVIGYFLTKKIKYLKNIFFFFFFLNRKLLNKFKNIEILLLVKLIQNVFLRLIEGDF